MEWVSSTCAIPLEAWRSCFRAPLEGEWYYRAFESGAQTAHGAPFTFAYGVLRLGARIVGIVPTFTVDVPLALGAPGAIARAIRAAERLAPALTRSRIFFVGSPNTINGAIGLVEGVRLADVLAIVNAEIALRAACERASMLVWKDFELDADDDAARGIIDAGFTPLASYPGTVMSVPGTWEHYLESLSGRRRYRLKKKLRLGRERAALESDVIAHPDDDTLAAIHALYLQTHEHAPSRFERMTPEFFRRIAHADEATFLVLREPGTRRIVAYMLLFIIGERAINRFVGLDYAVVRTYNLHFRLWEAAVRHCIAAGVAHVHSGPTAYRFKIETGHEPVPMTTYVKHRNPLINLIVPKLMRRAMARVVRRQLGYAGSA